MQNQSAMPRHALKTLRPMIRPEKLIEAANSILPHQSDELALNAHAVGRQDADLVGRVCRFQRNRRALAAEIASSVASSSSISATTISPVSAASVFLIQRRIAIENAGLDHRVAANFEREVFAGGRQHVGRHGDRVGAGLDRFDRRTGGDAAHHRDDDRAVAAVVVLIDIAWKSQQGGVPRFPSITLGVKPRDAAVYRLAAA